MVQTLKLSSKNWKMKKNKVWLDRLLGALKKLKGPQNSKIDVCSIINCSQFVLRRKKGAANQKNSKIQYKIMKLHENIY